MLYPTSLSDESWSIIDLLLCEHGFDSKRGRKYPLRTIVDACLYLVDNGTKWRNLPNDFPKWFSVYRFFRIWSERGIWKEINLALTEMVRFTAGREESPSLCSVDSQSQSGEPGIEERGLDGGKKVNGRKRHIAVDSLGLLLLCFCTSANTADCVGGWDLADELNDDNIFPNLAKILGDNAYKDVGKDFEIQISIEASERREKQKGFVPEAFRWAVERTFAWLNRQRRLTRNYEKKVTNQESMNYIGGIRICLKRLEKFLK